LLYIIGIKIQLLFLPLAFARHRAKEETEVIKRFPFPLLLFPCFVFNSFFDSCAFYFLPLGRLLEAEEKAKGARLEQRGAREERGTMLRMLRMARVT
jgi:hypothetical protein